MRHKRLSSFVRSQNIVKKSIFRRKSIKPRKKRRWWVAPGRTEGWWIQMISGEAPPEEWKKISE